MARTNYRFTPEEVQYLRDNYEQLGAKAVAEHLGISPKAVYNKVSTLKIRGKSPHGNWPEGEEKFLSDNFGKMSDRNIAKALNSTESRIVGKAKRMKLRRSKDEEWTDEQDAYILKHYTHAATDDFLAKLGKSRYEINCRARRLGIKKQHSTNLEPIICLVVFPYKRRRDFLGFGWGINQRGRYTLRDLAWESVKDREDLDFAYEDLQTLIMVGFGNYLNGEMGFLTADDPRLAELLASDMVKERVLNVGIPKPRPPRVKKPKPPKPPKPPKVKKVKEPKPPKPPKPPKVKKVKEPKPPKVKKVKEPKPSKKRIPRTTGMSQCYVVDAEGICGMAWTGGKHFNDFHLEVMKAHNEKFEELKPHQFDFTRVKSLDFYSKPLKFIDFNEEDDESIELMEVLRDLGFFARGVPMEEDTFVVYPPPKT